MHLNPVVGNNRSHRPILAAIFELNNIYHGQSFQTCMDIRDAATNNPCCLTNTVWFFLDDRSDELETKGDKWSMKSS